MLRFLGIMLLVTVVTVVTIGISIYAYLSPEEPLPRLVSPSSVRTIDTGELVGFQGKNHAHTWLGIPYAQSPVLDLRWKAPRPAMAWTGRREMLAYGPACVQLPTIPGTDDGRGIVGDENCLVLNIWAPMIGPTKIPTGDARLPVMFWIHGGGNSVGSGGRDQVEVYDGSLLATEHNVIVITVNYRMGPLGWFAHDALKQTAETPEDASGNYGTLDLIAALGWVQKNIANFGGDPHNITIFGESAGGSNVLSLMASPLAKGMFQQAIVQSGRLEIASMEEAQQIGHDNYGNDRLSSREITARWLVNAGRATDRDAAIALQDEMSHEELAVWLRSLSPADMYGIFDAGFAGMIMMPMIFGDGFVIPDKSTIEVFSDSNGYTNVPVMIGSTRDEMKLFMGFSPDYVEYTGNFITGIKDLAAYNRDMKYASDMWRAESVDSLAEMMSAHRPDAVFTYRFDADDWRNLGFIDLKDLLGAAHAFEIPFIFGYFPASSKIVFPDSTFDEVERLSDAMMSYWAEFAHHGTPGRGRVIEEPEWLPWRQGQESGHYMILDTDLDGGIRMTREVISLDEIKTAFFVDSSHKNQDEKCLSYRSAFFGYNYDQDEYTSLGCR